MKLFVKYKKIDFLFYKLWPILHKKVQNMESYFNIGVYVSVVIASTIVIKWSMRSVDEKPDKNKSVTFSQSTSNIEEDTCYIEDVTRQYTDVVRETVKKNFNAEEEERWDEVEDMIATSDCSRSSLFSPKMHTEKKANVQLFFRDTSVREVCYGHSWYRTHYYYRALDGQIYDYAWKEGYVQSCSRISNSIPNIWRDEEDEDDADAEPEKDYNQDVIRHVDLYLKSLEILSRKDGREDESDDDDDVPDLMSDPETDDESDDEADDEADDESDDEADDEADYEADYEAKYNGSRKESTDSSDIRALSGVGPSDGWILSGVPVII